MSSTVEPIASEIRAVLGPTNTGKTHRCIQRMLEHETGMIGLPLRLLAREVYDRVTELVGEQKVALVTGEEKRVPKWPNFWICTVEAMPMDQEVDFLAIDEIQLVSHPTRGHVFTQRLLHARGRKETWFLGASTAAKLLRALVPAAKHVNHPRLSRLSHAGQYSLGRLPPRSAVVAFSVPQVYELAERLRARKGGAAVVVGALSPRTRNAQVAMYQAGDVDYLVATDAIGMGLNMAVGHVAFSGLSKFDGQLSRMLSPHELAQIAGRAGRHLSDGTFGTLAPQASLPDEIAAAIEGHRFESQRMAWWRNDDLDFTSSEGLLRSLETPPRHPALRLMAKADDSEVLRCLLRRDRVRTLCRGASELELLWAIAQIPDYRKLMPEAHAELLLELYEQIVQNGCLDREWVERRVTALDDTDGDLDALTGRIASIRIWTYVSQRRSWLSGSRGWQACTRAIEDRLSDALHVRLLQRFVERRQRGRSFGRRTSVPERNVASFHSSSSIEYGAMEASPFAKLMDLKLSFPVSPATPNETSWVEELVDAPHDDFQLTATGRILHQDEELGRLVAGKTLLLPEVQLSGPNLSGGEARRLRRRLLAFARDVVEALKRGWYELEELTPAGRGLLYQLLQNLGTVERRAARAQLAALSPRDREGLKDRISIGRGWVWVPSLLRPDQIVVRRALRVAHFGGDDRKELVSCPPSVRCAAKASTEDYLRLGYAVLGPRAVRCDIAERALDLLRAGGDNAEPLRVLLGSKKSEWHEVLGALRRFDSAGRKRRRRRRRRSTQPNSEHKPEAAIAGTPMEPL